MKGSEEYLYSFMEGRRKRFVIPVYQRNYNWKNEQCKQLFDDLVALHYNHKNSHFFGSVVSVNENSKEYTIIDGQQRLTTVSLIMIAMIKAVENGVYTSTADIKIATDIKQDYIVADDDDVNKLRLRPYNDDKEAFSRIVFDTEDRYNEKSNVTINFHYFYNRIVEKQELSLSDLRDAIEKLQIISIELKPDQGDDPQLIFESLNSTGLALEESDKIRNYILMGLKPEKQERLYKNYWYQIERLSKEKLEEYIFNYLLICSGQKVKMSDIYKDFKAFAKDKDAEELLSGSLSLLRGDQLILQSPLPLLHEGHQLECGHRLLLQRDRAVFHGRRPRLDLKLIWRLIDRKWQPHFSAVHPLAGDGGVVCAGVDRPDLLPVRVLIAQPVLVFIRLERAQGERLHLRVLHLPVVRERILREFALRLREVVPDREGDSDQIIGTVVADNRLVADLPVHKHLEGLELRHGGFLHMRQRLDFIHPVIPRLELRPGAEIILLKREDHVGAGADAVELLVRSVPVLKEFIARVDLDALRIRRQKSGNLHLDIIFRLFRINQRFLGSQIVVHRLHGDRGRLRRAPTESHKERGCRSDCKKNPCHPFIRLRLHPGIPPFSA